MTHSRFALAWVAALGACGGTITSDDAGSDASDGGALDSSFDVVSETDGGPVVTAVAAGFNFTCALSTQAQVKCWGANNWGQLGNGTVSTWSLPLGLAIDSTAFTGLSVTVQLDGNAHACAPTASGDLYCWGDNYYAELGNGVVSSLGDAAVPMPIKAQALPPSAMCACGPTYTCALANSGNVYCWGDTNSGELGIGTPEGGLPPYLTTPTQVTLPQAATAVAAGDQTTCAIVGGEVWCWGFNADGECGDGTMTSPRWSPVQAQGLASVTAVSVGITHACAVAGGDVYCWGSGFLGDGNNFSTSTSPKLVPGLENVTSVTAGGGYTCVLFTSGTVKCWGSNARGNLGDGTLTDQYAPVSVQGLPPAIAISAGLQHTCALTASHQVMCWGDNRWGELGANQMDGGAPPSLSPVTVLGVP